MPKPMPAISEADIRDISGDKVYERGWSYFRRGAIFDPALKDELRQVGL